jgi:hypothetical protein
MRDGNTTPFFAELFHFPKVDAAEILHFPAKPAIQAAI